jgi:hypothetical protein
MSQTYTRNPSTNKAWTQTDINNLIACAGGSSWDYNFYITQVYVEVWIYADDTVYYAIDVAKRASSGTETALGSKVAQVSSLISALYDSPGLKSATWSAPQTALTGTDIIVVRVYQKVGTGAWNLVREFITEQLGAKSLDAATWTVYYYLDVSADTSYVYTVFWHGTSAYNSRIENFTWTPAPAGIPHFIGDGLSGAVIIV